MTPRECDAVRTVGFLLTPPSRRCCHVVACIGTERKTDALDKKASRWCLLGAVRLVAYHLKVGEYRLCSLVSERITGRTTMPLVVLWDGRTERQREELLSRLRTTEA